MSQAPLSLPEWHDVDTVTFDRDIAAHYQPAVLRGLVRHWPAVDYALQTPDAVCSYIAKLYNGKPMSATLVKPQYQGLQSYDETMDGFTFVRADVPFDKIVDQLHRYSHFEHPPSVAVQSALIADYLPGFFAENHLPLLADNHSARFWLGNRFIVPTHMDETSNIACVVAGRRRFTLFPPEQVANLYIGPLEFTPAGAPVSMVSLRNPDFERFPKFREALAASRTVELSPGDAIYIPPGWWHNVESLHQYNLLVNYWWHQKTAAYTTMTAIDCLYNCLLNLKHLDPLHRQTIGTFFNQYLFNTEDPLLHVPADKRGMLGDISPEMAAGVRQYLLEKLKV